MEEIDQDQIYHNFSKALLSTLFRTYADYIEKCDDKNDLAEVSNYFHFFKKVLSIDPKL